MFSDIYENTTTKLWSNSNSSVKQGGMSRVINSACKEAANGLYSLYLEILKEIR